MNNRNLNGFFLSTLAAFVTLGFTASGWAQDRAAIDLEKRGQVALKSETYPAALEYFSEGASRASDPKLKARLDFRQAVTLQQMASDPESGNPENQLRQAARLYQSYLVENPDSAAATNNQAKVYEQLGNQLAESDNPRQARRYYKVAADNYQKAVAVGDARQGLYLKNYAEFLESTGRWEKAKELYAQLIANHPLSPALQQSLADSFNRHGLQALSEYLWHLLDAGYVNQSTEFALNALQQSIDSDDQARIGLLTIVCASLAERTDDYTGFLNSKARNQASPLIKDDFLGRGVREIILLHGAGSLDRESYPWWRNHRLELDDPAIGLWPTDGFRALIRSLGSRAKRVDNLQLADAYFRLAADLEPWDIDPMAVRALVRMNAERNEFKKIDKVLAQYQVQLFESKAQAYRASSAHKIFLYHQTLGELYALIERWGDSNKVDSAIFQLEHAREFSMKLAGKSPETLPKKYQFTPPMVEVLASGYEKTGQPVEATKLRIDQAEFYQRANDTKAAIRILTPVRETDLSSIYKERYKNLQASPELMLPVQKLNIKGAVIKDKEGD